MPSLPITGDEAADKLLSEDPFALLLGMALDQQYRMEDAFKGGHKLVTRLGHLDPVPGRLVDRQRPANEPVGERLALEELHDEVLDARLVADVVQRADVGVREL